MPWTPIHAALGQTGTTLTAEMISLAISVGLEETAQIDWKRQLPGLLQRGTAQEQHQAELAKDVAAMANGDGGVIIYGVQERGGGSSAAGEVVSVGEVTDGVQRETRMAINGLTYPAVTGIDLQVIRWPGDRGDAVLALHIPASEDAPHLIHPKSVAREQGWFQVPWRDGASTKWMSERQIADAYRRREQRRRDERQSVADLYDEFLASVGAVEGSRCWVVAVAQPLRPIRDHRRLSKLGAQRFLDSALHHPALLDRNDFSAIKFLDGAETRLGYRMFSRSGSVSEGDTAYEARVEVHGNGALAVGATRGGILTPPDDVHPGHVATVDFEYMAWDLAGLLLKTVESGNVSGDFLVRIGVSPTPSAFRTLRRLGNSFWPAEIGQPVRRAKAPEGLVVTDQGREALLESLWDVVTDAMSQTGEIPMMSSSQLKLKLDLDN